MDPVTTALLDAATDIDLIAQEMSTLDAYNALIAILKEKLGAESNLVGAINYLVEDPHSIARQENVEKEVTAAKADQDPEIQVAAKRLQDAICQDFAQAEYGGDFDRYDQLPGDTGTDNMPGNGGIDEIP